MIIIQNLTTNSNTIKRNFNESDIVLLNCDATQGSFTVELPDATDCNHVVFKVVKKDSSSNTVTIKSIVSGQTINNESEQVLKRYGQNPTIITDNSNYIIN